MIESSPELALLRFAELAEGSGVRWIVGGSAGLRLRGAPLDRPPRDLDIYADAAGLRALHERLTAFAEDAPAWSETDRYRSLLSHYRLADVKVELVGDFVVRARDSVYRTEVDGELYDRGDRCEIGSREVRLVPLGHELIFNLLRERSDRAHTAAELIRRAPERHLPALLALLDRYEIAAAVKDEALALAAGKSASAWMGEERA
ncbi:hypothetical protein [Cohnella nanjingensis]|uniref:Nucleotidyl transferase AbiEii/AbiGii toxin family protein n=1 Tax=Cohnella nanjingensis TaxID=1387779 RepID=A0A7X0VHQ5_9BACL|nr:hypothetical protein [Cohnella nanjingensis]MBB6674156.1 hypothetical protein [Cohnella nanjingensis]